MRRWKKSWATLFKRGSGIIVSLQILHRMILYSVKGALSGLRHFYSNWKPLKNDEKCFLYHLFMSDI